MRFKYTAQQCTKQVNEQLLRIKYKFMNMKYFGYQNIYKQRTKYAFTKNGNGLSYVLVLNISNMYIVIVISTRLQLLHIYF